MASRLELAPGDAVRLTTTAGESVAGAVHALDEQTRTLVLRLAASEGKCVLVRSCECTLHQSGLVGGGDWIGLRFSGSTHVTRSDCVGIDLGSIDLGRAFQSVSPPQTHLIPQPATPICLSHNNRRCRRTTSGRAAAALLLRQRHLDDRGGEVRGPGGQRGRGGRPGCRAAALHQVRS